MEINNSDVFCFVTTKNTSAGKTGKEKKNTISIVLIQVVGMG